MFRSRFSKDFIVRPTAKIALAKLNHAINLLKSRVRNKLLTYDDYIERKLALADFSPGARIANLKAKKVYRNSLGLSITINQCLNPSEQDYLTKISSLFHIEVRSESFANDILKELLMRKTAIDSKKTNAFFKAPILKFDYVEEDNTDELASKYPTNILSFSFSEY